jgi:uncharacterized protein (DUF302 family)
MMPNPDVKMHPVKYGPRLVVSRVVGRRGIGDDRTMNQPTVKYGYVKRVNSDFAAAVEQTTAALKAEGFGVLTTIDVRDVLKKKLDAEFRPYKILGACNPHLAQQALSEEPEIGLLLPCNIVVQDSENGVTVSILDPKTMFSVVENPRLRAIADEADRRLRRVLDSLS